MCYDTKLEFFFEYALKYPTFVVMTVLRYLLFPVAGVYGAVIFLQQCALVLGTLPHNRMIFRLSVLGMLVLEGLVRLQ